MLLEGGDVSGGGSDEQGRAGPQWAGIGSGAHG